MKTLEKTEKTSLDRITAALAVLELVENTPEGISFYLAAMVENKDLSKSEAGYIYLSLKGGQK